MKETSLASFFNHLPFKDSLVEEEKAKLESYDSVVKEPIFIKILIGAGAWLASVFIMVFIGASGIVGDRTGAVVLGLFSLILGLGTKKIQTTFANQMSLALISTAHILIMYGGANIYDRNELTVILVIHSALLLLVYPFYNSMIYRFLAPLIAGFLAYLWILEEHLSYLFHPLVLCQVCCILLLFHHKKWSATLRPLAYSGLFFLPSLFMLNHATHFNSWGNHELISTYPSTIIVAIALILLICHFSDDWQTNQTTKASILITILLSLFTTPAILVAVSLFVLGHGLQNTLITILAYGYMPLSLTSYYYFMGVDLSRKSWIMMGSGLLLLGTRFLLARMQRQQENNQ